MSFVATSKKLPGSGIMGKSLVGVEQGIPPSALQLEGLPLAVLKSVRGRFNLSRAIDREINDQVADFLSKPSTLQAVLREFSGAVPKSVRKLSFVPGRIIGCGHTRIGVNLRVTMHGEDGEHAAGTLVLKMESRLCGEGRRVAGAAGAPHKVDIELRVNELLRGTEHRGHFVRTIASCIVPQGGRIALETCAHGEQLKDVFCSRYELGLAASTQAMKVMSDTWNTCKDQNGHGILFDSALDDIVVAGTTPAHVHACFVDCHEGRFIGGARLLLRAVARLMVDTLHHTPIGRERELLQSLSPELITARVLDPLRGAVEITSPESILAYEYGVALDQLKLDELGNPWEAAGLRL